MKSNKNQMYLIKIFISLAIITGIVFLYLFYSSLNFSKLNISTKIDKPTSPAINKFILTDQKGEKFDSTELLGHLSLIYFGVTYSSDDDEALNKIEDIIKILEKENIKIQAVFITLDPTSDTSKVMEKHLQKIDPDFIGLTGTDEEVAKVANKFKVFYETRKFDIATKQYKLNHSNFVYLISSDGKFLRHYCLVLPKDVD